MKMLAVDKMFRTCFNGQPSSNYYARQQSALAFPTPSPPYSDMQLELNFLPSITLYLCVPSLAIMQISFHSIVPHGASITD
eukprot:c41763_g1_i1 orf=247-489(+)